MTERERARETYFTYLSRAAAAQDEAAHTVGRPRERWNAAANLWLDMAEDLREVWKGKDWTVG